MTTDNEPAKCPKCGNKTKVIYCKNCFSILPQEEVSVDQEINHVLEKAINTLEKYSMELADKLRPTGSSSIAPRQSEVENAHRLFMDDHYRKILIKQIVDIKSCIPGRHVIIVEKINNS